MTAPRTVHLELHGAGATAHDYHTGTPGSFEQVMRTMSELRDEGSTVAVTTLLTRSSYRVLAELPPLLRARGVSAWCIAVPNASEAVPFERMMPRLALALPFALHALSLARRTGLPAWIRGAPLCLLGPYGSRSLPSEPRAYGEACDGCPARPHCPGVEAVYLERFHGDELRPRDAAPPDASDAELAAAFLPPGRAP